MRLSCGNSAFPLLSLEQSIRLVGLLEFEGFDLVMMGNSSHIRPEEITDIGGWTANVRALLDAEGLEASDVFCIPWTDFTSVEPRNHELEHRATCEIGSYA